MARTRTTLSWRARRRKAAAQPPVVKRPSLVVKRRPLVPASPALRHKAYPGTSITRRLRAAGYLRVSEVAQLLQRTRGCIHTWLTTGAVAGVDVGGAKYVDFDSVERLVGRVLPRPADLGPQTGPLEMLPAGARVTSVRRHARIQGPLPLALTIAAPAREAAAIHVLRVVKGRLAPPATGTATP